jgi:hypothetical protein
MEIKNPQKIPLKNPLNICDHISSSKLEIDEKYLTLKPKMEQNGYKMEIKNPQKSPEISPQNFFCNKCDYFTCNKKDFNKHCLTSKHLKEKNPKKIPKKSPKKSQQEYAVDFCCNKCEYFTNNKKDFHKHCLTSKHLKEIYDNPNLIENEIKDSKSSEFYCECGKIYKYYSGLYKHQNSCNFLFSKKDNLSFKEQITPELILKVIEQNKELTNVILQQNNTINKLCDNNNNNTNITNNTQFNNSNNNNNKTFNLNLYLNETCKNAMNIDEFVENIKLSLDDLEYTGRKGYIEGISNIILKNLKRLGEYDRPIHCSDYKREVLYIKSNNTWNKEEENKPILTNAIKTIANHNIKQITKWKEKNPDCINANSKKNNLYLKIVSNSMCGISKEETNKNLNKILSNVAKEVIINKNN